MPAACAGAAASVCALRSSAQCRTAVRCTAECSDTTHYGGVGMIGNQGLYYAYLEEIRIFLKNLEKFKKMWNYFKKTSSNTTESENNLLVRR